MTEIDLANETVEPNQSSVNPNLIVINFSDSLRRK
jgi:hypothetical protein